jgi:hypothetical protein
MLFNSKRVSLFLSVSPFPIKDSTSVNDPYSLLFKEIKGRYNVSILDFRDDKHYLNKYELFRDMSHLNRRGSELYTSQYADSVSCLLKNNYSFTIQKKHI